MALTAARGSCSNRWKRRSDNSTRCCTGATRRSGRGVALRARCPTMRRTCCCRRCCGCAPRRRDRPGHQPGQPRGHAGATGRREIDLALGVFPDAPGDIKRETLFEEHFVSVADRRSLPQGRPAVAARLERPTYWSRCGPTPKRDRRRAEGAGPAPHVALTLPHWSASTEVLAGTDLIRRFSRAGERRLGQGLETVRRPSICRHSHSSRHGTAGAIPIRRFAG